MAAPWVPTPEAASSGTAVSGDFPVEYTRTAGTGSANAAEHGVQTGELTNPQSILASQALNTLLNSNEDQVRKIQDQLVQAGLLKKGGFIPGVADAETRSAYTDLLKEAGQRKAAGKDVTVDEVAQDRIDHITAAGGLDALSGGPKHTTSTQVDHTTPLTAQQALQQAMQQHLGRNPSAKELAAFQSALGAYEGANPQVATRDVNSDGSGETTTTAGGVSPGPYADAYVMNQYGQEANTHTVATDYYGAALKLIGMA